jgi:hypothetical protein
MFFLLSLMLSLLQNQRTKKAEQILPRKGAGKVAQIMYTHVSKCENNKIKIF